MIRWRMAVVMAAGLSLAVPAHLASALPTSSTRAAGPGALVTAVSRPPTISPLVFGTHTFGPANIRAQRQPVGSVRTPTAQWEWVEPVTGR